MGQVDYAALAAQHGGTAVAPPMDYAALAAKHGGAPVQAPAAPSLLDEVRSGVSDVVVGAVKGAGQTATNLGRLVHKIPLVSAATDALYGMPKGASDQAFTIADRVLAPTNTAQRIGKGAEQIAEVLAPGKAITSAGTGLAARLAPRLAPVVGDTAANLLPRAAVEAAGGAGMAEAQGGDPLVGGALGAAAAIVPGLATSQTAATLREQAEKKVVQALGPTKERFKAMANRLSPQILQRGLGGSRKALQERAAGMVEQVGTQIDDALQQFGAQSSGTAPVTAALEAAKDAFRTTNAAGKVVEFEPRAIRQLDRLQQVITDLGPDATVDQLVAIRRAWDKVVDQAGGFAHRAGGAIGVPLKDQSEAWAKREGAGAIRSLLATDVPELAAVNKEFAFWKSLDSVLTQTLQRTEAQGPGLGRQVAEAAGAAAASSHGLGPAVLAGKVGKMANAVFTSPRWRFVDAKLRNALADAIMSGSAGQTTSVLTRIAAVQASKLQTVEP